MTADELREKAVTRALWAIQAYVLAARKPPPIIVEESRLAHAQKLPDHVSDLLTDLMHYCHGGEYSFEDCLKTARINFEAEKSESYAQSKEDIDIWQRLVDRNAVLFKEKNESGMDPAKRGKE